MKDHRIGLDLFTDVLDVLGRHGFARGDDEHAGRAIFVIGDLARIYEGSQDHPYGPSISQALSRSTSPEPPGPEPNQDRPSPTMIWTPSRYSIDEAARLTGLSRDLLYDEMRRGNLTYVKVGRRRLITRHHLQEFLGDTTS
jgi:excisionase family DNA binding protein